MGLARNLVSAAAIGCTPIVLKGNLDISERSGNADFPKSVYVMGRAFWTIATIWFGTMSRQDSWIAPLSNPTALPTWPGKSVGLKSLRKKLERSPEFGGSPLLQRCGKSWILSMRFSAGLENPGLKPVLSE
jgi:hypothetical protein